MPSPITPPAGSGFALQSFGTGLERPECVLATASGRLYVSDRRGGVMAMDPDGAQRRSGESALVPNGIALQPDGSFLIANLGPDGGVWRLDAQGAVYPWLMEFEGQRLPRVNFVSTDGEGRTWVCVSATETDDHYPVHSATGFVLVHDRQGTRLAADGLRYTNELRISACGRHAYVNETFGRCTTRLRVAQDGALVDRATVAEFEAGDFPDGLTLDAEGGIWVVCVGSNRLYRINPDGRRETMIDDADPIWVDRLERALQAGQLTRTLLSSAAGRTLRNITSLAFGGPDLKTAYMGSLAGDTLVSFRSPVAGLRPAHWEWDAVWGQQGGQIV